MKKKLESDPSLFLVRIRFKSHKQRAMAVDAMVSLGKIYSLPPLDVIVTRRQAELLRGSKLERYIPEMKKKRQKFTR